MNGWDIQLYERMKDKAQDLGIVVKPSYDKILFFTSDGRTLGGFENVKEAFSYLCGYQYGISTCNH